MTFVASVVAKKGVAVIADSLVTSSKPIIEWSDFLKYVKAKGAGTTQSIQLDLTELVDLFKAKPSFTKDYEEKLFQYDQYTAITTAGVAVINSKRIADLVQEIVEKNNSNKKSYSQKPIDRKVRDFCDFLTNEVKNSLATQEKVGSTSFILTHFDRKACKTFIYKVRVEEALQSELSNPDKQYVTYSEAPPIAVVCDGQNRITEDILYGRVFTVDYVIQKIIEMIGIGLKMCLTKVYQEEIKEEIYKLTGIQGELKIAKLNNLSLQQAVDLANLLMKIEMDFQKYTEDIPTVGGVIKIAVIDAEGFRFVAGHKIINPVTLH